jgi:mRNA interferase RelE/StbE
LWIIYPTRGFDATQVLDRGVTLSYNLAMGYDIILSRAADRKLHQLPPKLANRIVAKLEEVAQNPYGHHHNVAKLQGREGYRLRVGDWRIIYELHDNQLILFAVEIGSRGGIYQ